MRRIFVLSLSVLLGAAAAVPAGAHVTVQPNEAATASFARFVVRVPNEREAAATVKVEVQLPEDVVAVSFQPVPGWTRTVERKTRSTPVEVFGEQVSDYVASVTWQGGRIEPGEFQDFGFSARTPEEAATLTFPAVQTYEGGELVRWTGPADAEEPAARVRTYSLEGGQVELLSKLSAEVDGGDDDDDGEVPAVVSWAALVLGAAGLVTGLGARRRRT